MQNNTVFVLVHGAWHNALHWNPVANLLSLAGYGVVAIDLPGHGLKAKYPASYLTQDVPALLEEPTPLGADTFEDYCAPVISAVQTISPDTRIILVGHSMGGIVVTKVADLLADRIARVVYVTAFCPVRFPNSLGYISSPQFEGVHNSAYIGDPSATGAVRINPRSNNPTDLEDLRACFYSDMSMADAIPFITCLTPDLPFSAISADTRGTTAGWGRVPRTYVRCTQDRALPIASQDMMIADADAEYLENPFTVRSLKSSHSPFASMPKELAQLLMQS